MQPEMILQSDLLDILFESRNKSYGAYVLRKEYPKQLWKSLGIMLLLIGISISISFYNNNRMKERGVINFVSDSIVIHQYDVPKEKPPQPIARPSAPKPPAATIVNHPPVIVPDDMEHNKTPTITELQNSIVGDSAKAGPPVDFNSNPAPTGGTDKGKEEAKESNNDVQPEITWSPEVRPEFPGGVEGWRRFLQKNLKSRESDEAYKITVIVKFVVNEDGTISNLEIAQSGGQEFDNEVLRVMKKSPRWIAGSNGGRKVKVYHAQPVVFINQVDE